MKALHLCKRNIISKSLLPHAIFQVPVADANSTAAPALPPSVHVHSGSLSRKHGLRHHKLTTHHNPQLSSLLSAESAESAEIVPVAPSVFDAAATAAAAAPTLKPVASTDPTPGAADPAPDSDSASTSDASASKEIPVFLFKRDVPAEPAPAAAEITLAQIDPVPTVPACPGRVRFFK